MLRAGTGLDQDGLIVREGALAKVPSAFAEVVAHARVAVAEAFGPESLDSAYLYGSIPRGTAVAGRSDLDLLLALRHRPTDADRATADALQRDLDHRFAQLNGAGILLFGAAELLSEAERYDLGWFVACLCTPLLGDDLGERLPRYRPSGLLARETNGDLADRLPRWRARAAAATTADDPAAERRALSRGAGRHLVRTGFTLVMPRWPGWTSDLAESAEVFAHYYPQQADQMRAVAAAAPSGSTDPALLHLMFEELGPWLATEYTAVHGVKTPRPQA
ncbi:nucleotidyltransferase domain-containing protein [Kitasatospora sp. NBC_01287]|uniref:nucleotidyltransferase domain-containing protein n=1 Tax=Kitasatospora sp. NBC_01287 TaxID=2903573 RepID=UPI002250885D|nr:nucleotidyltransferase domain-containing protein [Kitasatospora sp. NBC_01287]MCX4745555.1 nucleotidyltransferase domain-containing protein [Kitasatospora sp. NBC_01287]